MFVCKLHNYSISQLLNYLPIRQITIIGNGLIGGSLGLALKKHNFRGRIVGCDREATLERARARGAIDQGASDPGDAVRGSEIVVLAAPVLAILDLIERLGPSLPAKALLTDVGSTKVAVMERSVKVFGKHASRRFLGGHPMAGKEISGVDNADPDLFHNAAWFLTPLPDQNLNDGLVSEFVGWIEQIGARIAMLPPEKHDHLCAWISHMLKKNPPNANNGAEDHGWYAALTHDGSARSLKNTNSAVPAAAAAPPKNWRVIKKNPAGTTRFNTGADIVSSRSGSIPVAATTAAKNA